MDPHPKFGSNEETDDATHTHTETQTPGGYEKL